MRVGRRVTAWLLAAALGLASRPSLAGCGGTGSYQLGLDRVDGPPWAGFGGQLNPSLYDPRLSRPIGMTAADRREVARDVQELAPQQVRIFFDQAWLTDCIGFRAFLDTVDLAQRSGAAINLTYWKGGGYPHPAAQMEAFASLLSDLREGTHRSGVWSRCGVSPSAHSSVRYVTVQNEPNNDPSNAVNIEGRRPDLYSELYHQLDHDLRDQGTRGQLKLIGGDLVSTNAPQWFHYMASRMSDVLDGYSIHVYWNAGDLAKLTSRLESTRQLVNGLPRSGRKPLYVTEFGVNGAGSPAPGRDGRGLPVERDPRTVLEEGWFDLLAARLGYVATSKWDLNPGLYAPPVFADAHRAVVATCRASTDPLQRAFDPLNLSHFSLIGTPREGLPLLPGFDLTRMLDHAVPLGAHEVGIAGPGPADQQIAAFRKGQEVTLLLANDGACSTRFALSGLPGGRVFHVQQWTGQTRGRPALTTGGDGTLEVTVPPYGVTALTTFAPAP